MRLGAYAAVLNPGSQIYRMYEESGRIVTDRSKIDKFRGDTAQRFRLGRIKPNDIAVVERHRHATRFNPAYIVPLHPKGDSY